MRNKLLASCAGCAAGIFFVTGVMLLTAIWTPLPIIIALFLFIIVVWGA